MALLHDYAKSLTVPIHYCHVNKYKFVMFQQVVNMNADNETNTTNIPLPHEILNLFLNYDLLLRSVMLRLIHK